MTASLSFVVDGCPVPWERVTAGKHKPKRTREYQKLVAWTAKIQCGGNRCPVLIGAIRARMIFVVQGGSRGDWDNYAKTIGDACQEVVYANDAQIMDAHVTVKPAGDTKERAIITFEEMSDG